MSLHSSAVLCLSLLVAATLVASPAVHRDLAYAKPRNERQCLDVYVPPDGQNHPIVLWIHGGSWQRGDKSELAVGNPSQHELKPKAFVERGCVFVAMNYRFFPAVTLREI